MVSVLGVLRKEFFWNHHTKEKISYISKVTQEWSYSGIIFIFEKKNRMKKNK